MKLLFGRENMAAKLMVGISLALFICGALAMNNVSGKDNSNPIVVMETSEGKITIELYEEKAPITVENFLWYVDHKFYDGLIFHRVIPDFVIQGGGFNKDMLKKQTNPAIKNEAKNGLKNLKYTLSMARTNDVNSATSQFFINLRDNTALDHGVRGFGYAVFGKVVGGMDVVDGIATVRTTTKGTYKDVPAKPMVIEKAYRVEGKGGSGKEKK